MDKMRIMQIIPTLGGGGAENMVLQLAYGLRKQFDAEVVVVSLYDKGYATTGRLEFAHKNNIKVLFLNKKAGFDIALLKQMSKLIKRIKPDIIHTHLHAFQYILLLRIIHKFNHFHTVHSIAGRENIIYESCFKIASKLNTTSFIALTPSIENDMKTRYGVNKRQIKCIANGVDLSRFMFKERRYCASKTTFVIVGSLIPVKNHSLLINAFKTLCEKRNYRDNLIIVGDGELKNSIFHMIEQLGISQNVKLTGNVDNVADYLYTSDVFVLCSKYEGVSLALLEAAATGLPLIVTSTGGTPEIVKDDAILVPDDNPKELSDAMLLLANDCEKYNMYCMRSANIGKRYSLEKMVATYYCYYKEKRK